MTHKDTASTRTGWTIAAATALAALLGSSVLAGPMIPQRGGGDRSSTPRTNTGRSDSGGTANRDSGRTYRPSGSGDTYRPIPRSDTYRPKARSDSYTPSTPPQPPAGTVYTPSPRTGNVHTPTTGYRPGTSTGDRRSPDSTYRRVPGTDYRPIPRSGSVHTPTTDYRPSTNSRTSYRSDYANRGSKFERVRERPRAYDRYYHNGYYRPYSGWHEPRYNAGFYYYSWPYEVEPCHYGFYLWDADPGYSYRSLYYYYGYFPYVYSRRVIVVDRPTVVYVERPISINYDDDYYLSRPAYGSVGEALDDIRDAWTSGRSDLLANHLRNREDIAVFLDGSYSYSINQSDYLDMTRDAMERVETVSFTFDRVRQRDNGQVVAYGVHKYYDSNNDLRTVYLSFTLERQGGDWYITEVGSSNRPLGR